MYGQWDYYNAAAVKQRLHRRRFYPVQGVAFQTTNAPLPAFQATNAPLPENLVDVEETASPECKACEGVPEILEWASMVQYNVMNEIVSRHHKAANADCPLLNDLVKVVKSMRAFVGSTPPQQEKEMPVSHAEAFNEITAMCKLWLGFSSKEKEQRAKQHELVADRLLKVEEGQSTLRTKADRVEDLLNNVFKWIVELNKQHKKTNEILLEDDPTSPDEILSANDQHVYSPNLPEPLFPTKTTGHRGSSGLRPHPLNLVQHEAASSRLRSLRTQASETSPSQPQASGSGQRPATWAEVYSVRGDVALLKNDTVLDMSEMRGSIHDIKRAVEEDASELEDFAVWVTNSLVALGVELPGEYWVPMPRQRRRHQPEATSSVFPALLAVNPRQRPSSSRVPLTAEYPDLDQFKQQQTQAGHPLRTAVSESWLGTRKPEDLAVVEPKKSDSLSDLAITAERKLTWRTTGKQPMTRDGEKKDEEQNEEKKKKEEEKEATAANSSSVKDPDGGSRASTPEPRVF